MMLSGGQRSASWQPKSRKTQRLGLLALSLIVLVCTARPSSAEPPAASDASTLARLSDLVQQLDADRFDTRRRAAEELEELVASGKSAALLARQFRQALARPEVSFELRTQLEGWLKRLPETQPAAQPRVDEDELVRLIEQLEADSHAERLNAGRRLEELAGQEEHAIALMQLMRNRLAAAKLSADTRNRLTPIYGKARGTWLLSDPKTWKLPPVSRAEIEQAVRALSKPAADTKAGAAGAQIVARRELLDLLARDELVPDIQEALKSQLAEEGLDDAARQRLQELLDATRPALVAEIWQGRRNILTQHLLVDVPSQSQGALRPSHFDRVDDRMASCVSGNNLLPGEYPVGVAIAHPERAAPPWTCQIVNLPTPRRRMAYEYTLELDEEQRLAELTERTMRRYIDQKLHLSELEILYLQELHPGVVSRLIGEYFLAVDDQRLEPGSFNLGGVNVSHHGRIAFILSQISTQEIAPGLLKALAGERFLAPVANSAPYHWPWIAALSIAARDPWPELDAWLAGLIERNDPLVVGVGPDDEENGNNVGDPEAATAAPPPELGAAAAALLLTRHELSPSSFGLVELNYAMLSTLDCPSYRFSDPEGRAAVKKWWTELQRSEAQKGNTP